MKAVKTYLLSVKTYSFLIAAFLVSIPLPYAYSTTILIVLLAVSLASSIYHKIEFKKELLLPIVFYLFMAISLLWTIEIDQSLRGLERQLSFLLVPLAFIFMPSISMKVLLQSFYIFATSIAILAIFLLINAFYAYSIDENMEVFFYHTILLPLDLNAIYMSVMTSLSLLYMLFYSKKSVLNWIISIVLFSFLILLSSKNVLAVTILCVIIGMFLTKKSTKRQLLFIGLFIIGIITILLVSPLKNRLDEEFTSNIGEVLNSQEFNKIYPWTGSTIRLFQARITYELLEEDQKFLSGYGINASQEKIIQKQNDYNLYFGYNKYNTHNQYVQSFLELGALGLIFILVLLAITLKNYLSQKELISLFFFIIMTAIFITETYVWRQRGMYHFLIIYGMLISIDQKKGIS